MKKTVFLTILAFLVEVPLFAVNYQTIEQDCLYQIYQGTTTDNDVRNNGGFQPASSATHVLDDVLLSWSLESVGAGSATFTLAHSTFTNPTSGAISTIVSSNIVLNSGKIMSDDVRGMVKRPRIRILDLPASTTVFVRMVYCKSQKNP